jgi:hypothetical protein
MRSTWLDAGAWRCLAGYQLVLLPRLIGALWPIPWCRW